MVEVQEINHLRTLASYRLLWNSLFDETPSAGFQQSFEWLQQYWRHYGNDKKLRVFVVKSAGHNVGVLPLCVVRRRHKMGTLRELTYPLDNWGSYYGPIGGNPTATLTAALRHIANTRRDWDCINFGWASASAKNRTQIAMQQLGFTPQCELQHQTSIIDFSSYSNYEEYLGAVSKKTRHEFRRHERRVAEQGRVEFIRHRPQNRSLGDGDPRWDLYDECEQISRNSWQASSTTGNTLCDREYAGFFRDCHNAAARIGMLDLALLRLDGKPVAYCYGYHHRGRVVGLRMGYDSNSPVGGVGNVLLGRLIADSIERGDQHLDLGAGSEKYKTRVRTQTEPIYQISHASRSAWRAQVVDTAHWLRKRASLRAS